MKKLLLIALSLGIMGSVCAGKDEDLAKAAYEGNLSKVQELLKAGASPIALSLESASGLKLPPLYWVAYGRVSAKSGKPLGPYLDIARALLGKGARVNQRATDGTTPVNYAVLMGDENMARFLFRQPGINVTESADRSVSLGGVPFYAR